MVNVWGGERLGGERLTIYFFFFFVIEVIEYFFLSFLSLPFSLSWLIDLFFVIIFVMFVNRKQLHLDACWLDGRRRGNRKYSPPVFRLFLARKRAQLQNGALQALVVKTFDLTILYLGRTKKTVFFF